jgi:hypothetical protein
MKSRCWNGAECDISSLNSSKQLPADELALTDRQFPETFLR